MFVAKSESGLWGHLERALLVATLLLVLFFFLYVHVFGQIRGPFAKEYYYELSDYSDVSVKGEYPPDIPGR